MVLGRIHRACDARKSDETCLARNTAWPLSVTGQTDK